MVTHVRMSMSAKINRVTMCVSTRQEGRLFYKLLVRAVNGLLLVKNGAENLANSVPT
jgi:hypothetical protein